MIKIYFGSEDFTEYAGGLDDIKEKYSEKEDGSLDLSLTSTIVFSGKAYKYILDLKENSCEAINNEYPVRIQISKCSQSLDFILKLQGVSIDPINCKAKVNLTAANETDAQFEILSKHIFWNHDFKFLETEQPQGQHNGQISKMLHAHETGFLTWIIALIWFRFLLPLAVLVNAIFDKINTLLSLVSNIKLAKIPVDGPSNDLLGGGEYTTAYYIKNILSFWAKQAGLTFKSPIFQAAPYDESVLWSLQNNNGIDIEDKDKPENTWDEKNLPDLTPVQILNSLKPVFNAQWKIIGTELIFARKDYFDDTRVKAFHLEEEIQKGNILEVEYTFTSEPNFARFLGSFGSDPADLQGNKAKAEFYTYNKDYNKGLTHKNRKGDRKIDINYGGVRCTEDFKANSFMSAQWDGLAQSVGPRLTHSIVIESDTAQLQKILVLAPHKESTWWKGTEFRTVIKEQVSPPTLKLNDFDQLDLTGKWEYNIPYWMVKLYDLFHFIDDPDQNNSRIIEINTLTWKPDDFCKALKLFKTNRLNTYIDSKDGKGNILTFEIDYPKCLFKFEKVTFKCQ